jgi:tetratricopeptide (TPR) repeat protein
MKRRLDRGPYVALGINEGANAQTARAAFLQLTKTYHPAKFAREAPEIVRQANEVFLALRAAYDSITNKRSSQPFPAQARPDVPAPPQRPPSGTPPEPVRDALREAARRSSTPGRGVPIAPVDRREATPVRGVPVQSSPTPAAPRSGPALGVSIKGAQKPVATKDKPTPEPAHAFTLPPGVEPGSEEADLEIATHLLRRKNWTEARRTLHALAARAPKEKRYRALLAYARGREAQDIGRHDEARTEFTRALQLDPDLGVAKAALGQVAVADPPPEKPSGGLFSRLFKK